LCVFLLDDDYETVLDTNVADITKYMLDIETDYILATELTGLRAAWSTLMLQ
jgi:hypothetical protein